MNSENVFLMVKHLEVQDQNDSMVGFWLDTFFQVAEFLHSYMVEGARELSGACLIWH